MKYYTPAGRRDFWIRETGTGQQVAQLHERCMMMMMIMMMITDINTEIIGVVLTLQAGTREKSDSIFGQYICNPLFWGFS